MRRRLVFRGWALVWAVLQFALPLGATLADVQVERLNVRAPGAHVESTSSESCRPAHPDECTLCQFLSRATGDPESPTHPAIAVAVRPTAPARTQTGAARDLARVSLPRAPPVSAA